MSEKPDLELVAARRCFMWRTTPLLAWRERRTRKQQFEKAWTEYQRALNGGDEMGFIKHGHGEVLPESEQEQKTASQNWTEQDREELARENTDTDE